MLRNVSPVTFPVGRASCARSPADTASPIDATTKGMVVVSLSNAWAGRAAAVTMTSGLSATSSRASAGISSAFPFAFLSSNLMFPRST